MITATHGMMTEYQPKPAPRLARIFRLWRDRVRERHTFQAMGHRELRELGMSQWQVEQELAKPFWRG